MSGQDERIRRLEETNAALTARLEAYEERLGPRVKELLEQLRQPPVDIEDVPWLVKDFDVLYRAAERLAQACHGRGNEGPYAPLHALDAQLERLKPAMEQIALVKANLRGRG